MPYLTPPGGRPLQQGPSGVWFLAKDAILAGFTLPAARTRVLRTGWTSESGAETFWQGSTSVRPEPGPAGTLHRWRGLGKATWALGRAHGLGLPQAAQDSQNPSGATIPPTAPCVSPAGRGQGARPRRVRPLAKRPYPCETRRLQRQGNRGDPVKRAPGEDPCSPAGALPPDGGDQ